MWSMIKNVVKGVGSVIKNFFVDHKDVFLELLQAAVAIAIVVGLCYIAWPILFPMMVGSFSMLFGSSTLGVLAAAGLAGIMTAVTTGAAVYMVKTKAVMKGFDWLGDKWRAHKSKDVVFPEGKDENDAKQTAESTHSRRSSLQVHDEDEEDDEEDDDEDDDIDNHSVDHKEADEDGENLINRRHQANKPPHVAKSNTSSSSSNRKPRYSVEDIDDNTNTVSPSSNSTTSKTVQL